MISCERQALGRWNSTPAHRHLERWDGIDAGLFDCMSSPASDACRARYPNRASRAVAVAYAAKPRACRRFSWPDWSADLPRMVTRLEPVDRSARCTDAAEPTRRNYRP